jgi:hypothetical protein
VHIPNKKNFIFNLTLGLGLTFWLVNLLWLCGFVI